MANLTEIAIELKRLTDTLPPPRGVTMQSAYAGYEKALIGFPADVIHEAIDRYLSAEFKDVSLKFYPRAPELAGMVRQVRAEQTAAADKQRRADQLAAERREMDKSEKLRIKTPEQKARAVEIMRRFHEANDEARKRIGKPRNTEPRDPTFVINSRDPYRARTPTPAQATDEAAPLDPDLVAAIPDRPLPKGMAQVGDAVPAVPPGRERRDDGLPGKTLDPVEALAFEDIGEFLKANT